MKYVYFFDKKDIKSDLTDKQSDKIMVGEYLFEAREEVDVCIISYWIWSGINRLE